MKILGAIREVNEYDMVISLPNGLNGFVHITHFNEKITERLKEMLQTDDSDSKETEARDNLEFVESITIKIMSSNEHKEHLKEKFINCF